MDFLHTDFMGGTESVAIVTLDGQANVMLLDDDNLSSYRRGTAFNYYGGWATHSPVRLKPPRYGHWHIVVDLGGDVGRVRASVRIVSAVTQGELF